MPKSRGKRGRGGGNNKQAPDAKKRRTTNTNNDSGSLFDVQPHVGMKCDARDVDYIWSSATLIRVSRKKQTTAVTIRFDGWGKPHDETLEWNFINSQKRLAPLYSFTKSVKCLVDLFPKKRSTPTDEELDSIPRNAPETYCNLWPCKVQFRMPHPQDNDEDDSEDCRKALADLKLEPHVFIQPYHIEELPQQVLDTLKENDGMWIKAKRIQPWTDTPTKDLGVLPPSFMEAFHLANEDVDTPGVLPHGSSVITKGSLLKEHYRVHSRKGSLVRDGALREEDKEDYENEEEYSEEEVVEEDFVERKLPAQPVAMQQQQQPSRANSDSKASGCVVM